MTNSDSDSAEPSSARFLQNLRPLRDLQSNWTVDLAQNLEDYLLKICSGNVSADDEALFSVNFAEGGDYFRQGSVQVYSRKVEYLYSLVVHALEFLSQKSQGEAAAAGESGQQNAASLHGKDESDDSFWGLDNITVETKNLLDGVSSIDAQPSHYVRPPANLVVLEGECLDAVGDTGELETYLLATNDLYRDFILLDSSDAAVVDDFLGCKARNCPDNLYRGSSISSKGCKIFQSPYRQSEETGRKSSAKKNQDVSLPKSPSADHGFGPNDGNEGPSPNAYDFPHDDMGFGAGDSEPGDLGNTDDDDDDDDPWKPLNPHEPGTLKVKPYRKVKSNRRAGVGSRKHHPLAVEFPVAKLQGPINTELTRIWEERFGADERDCKPQALYERLRQTLCPGIREKGDAFLNSEDNVEYGSGDSDIEPPDFGMPDNTFEDEEETVFQEKPLHNEPTAHSNLEDLCQSHLDALLASLTENEKQTELATRVSTWKQRIEKNLEEQDSRPPFDIHRYGDRVLDKLSEKGEGDKTMSFGDVVTGQEKHEVARTFSALLQLVNNGDIDLVRSSPNNSCHSGANPFYVRLLKNERKKGILLRSSKKRAKSPISIRKQPLNHKHSKENENSLSVNSPSPGSCRFSISVGKQSRGGRCTPEGKKRRKSRIVSPPLDVNFVG